jgi:hypothetical protein
MASQSTPVRVEVSAFAAARIGVRVFMDSGWIGWVNSGQRKGAVGVVGEARRGAIRPYSLSGA